MRVKTTRTLTFQPGLFGQVDMRIESRMQGVPSEADDQVVRRFGNRSVDVTAFAKSDPRALEVLKAAGVRSMRIEAFDVTMFVMNGDPAPLSTAEEAIQHALSSSLRYLRGLEAWAGETTVEL